MRAGTLLKQRIPIRTFEEWRETQPGLSSSGTGAPIVAQTSMAAVCIRLSLTDRATGWTKCLPLLHRREVPRLSAIQRARTLFPFSVPEIDTNVAPLKRKLEKERETVVFWIFTLG